MDTALVIFQSKTKPFSNVPSLPHHSLLHLSALLVSLTPSNSPYFPSLPPSSLSAYTLSITLLLSLSALSLLLSPLSASLSHNVFSLPASLSLLSLPPSLLLLPYLSQTRPRSLAWIPLLSVFIHYY